LAIELLQRNFEGGNSSRRRVKFEDFQTIFDGSHMKHCKLSIALLTSIVAMSAFAGCNKDKSMLEVDENVWPTYTVPGEGCSLALPPNWRRHDLDQQLVKLGAKFAGIDESSIKMGFTTNASVMREPNPLKTTDLDVVVAFNLKEMWQMKFIKSTIDHKRLNLATGDCERFHFRGTTQIPPTGKTVLASFTSFIFVKGTDSYTLTLTTLPETEEYYAPIFEKIGQSFQIDK
jgi:hypothetical protein